MAGSFADAYVQILPKMADFGAELKRALGGIKNVEVPVSLKFDAGKITQQLADLTKAQTVSITATADADKAKTILDALDDPRSSVITAVADAQKATSVLGGLAKPIDVSVTPDVDTARAARELSGLKKPFDISVTPVIDDAKARGALGDLKKPVDISVTPVIDDAKARLALTDLDKPLDISVRPVLEDSKVRGALADLGRAITVPLDVKIGGRARSELADLTKPDTKIIEVEYVSKGGADPYESFTRSGTEAGEKAGKNVTAGMAGAIGAGMKGPAALLIGGLGIKAIVDSGGDFQVAMAKIQVQTGATAKEMADVDKLTLQLGKDQKLGAASAGDAAAAIQTLTKGQFSLKEAMDISRNALQLSIVSQQDAATASGQLATAMAQLKVPVADAAAVVDSLAAADLKGIIGSAGDYAVAIQYAGTAWSKAFANQEPLERLYGLQTALVALDNQAGYTGSHSGETIRRLLTDMTGPTKKAKEGIQDLTEAFKKNGGVLRDGGSVFVTAAGQMRPLEESLKNLNVAFKDLNPQEQIDLLEPVFTTIGKDGVQLLAPVVQKLGEGASAWDEYGAAVRRTGITQQLADAYAVGLKGAFSGLAGALETTAIQTAKAISPLLIPAINGLGTAISGLGVIIPPVVAGLQVLFGKLADSSAFRTAVDVFGRLKTSIGSIFDKPTTTGSWMVDQFLAAQTPADNLRFAIQRIRDEFPLVDRAAKIFETKILPAIQTVSTFITGTLIPAISDIGTKVAGIGSGVFGFFKEWDLKAKIAAGALASITAGIVATTIVLPAFTAAATGAGIAIGVLTSPVTLVVAGITALAIGVKLAYDNFKPFHQAVDRAWQIIVKLPGPTWLAVAALGALGLAVFAATGPIGLLVLGVGALATAVGLLVLKNDGVRDFIGSVGRFSGLADIVEGVTRQFQGLKEMVSGTVEFIKGVFSGDMSSVTDGLRRGLEGVKNLLLGIAQVAFAPVLGALRGMKELLDKIGGKPWKAVVEAGGNAKEWLAARLADVKTWTSKSWKAVVEAGGGAKQWVVDRLTDVRKLTGTAWKVAVTAGGNALQWVKDVVSWLKQIVSKVISISINIPGMGLLREAANLVSRLGGGNNTGVVDISRRFAPGGSGTTGSTGTTRATGQTSGRAEGGPVEAGTPYIVGEEGPELFFPRVSGEIFTNTDSARLLKQAKQKSFDAAGIIAKVLVRTPGAVQGSPTDKTFATLSSSFNEIVTAVDQATTSIADMGAGAVDFTDTVGRSSGDFVDTVTDAAGNLVDDVDTAGNHMVGIIDGAATGIGGIVQVTSGEIVGIIGGLEGDVDTAGTNMVGIVSTTGTQIGGIIQTTSTDMAGIAAGFAVDVDTAGTDIADTVIDYIVPAAQNIVDAIGENSPLDGAIVDVGDGLGDVSGGLGDLLVDLNAINSSSVVLALDTLANVINLNVLTAFDGFVAKLNSFDFTGGGGGAVDPVSAVGADGSTVRVDFVVPPPDGSQSNAATVPGSGGNPANTPGGTGGPLPYAVGDGVPGSGYNPNNTPSGSGGPISTAPVIPLPGPITNTLANGINSIFNAIGQFIPNATLLDGRAAGGPVRRGRPYLVGERGPELFVPQSFGNIRTNAALMAADLEVSRSLSGRDDVAERVAAAVKEALAEAGLDRPNLGGVYVNTEIPGWQVNALADELFDRIDARMARGN